MKADEKQQHEEQLEKNALAERLTSLADRAKTGQLVSFRLGAAVVILLVGGGLWWYLAKETRKASSAAWQALDGTVSADEYKNLAGINPSGTPAKVARLQLARLQLGPEGIQKLSSPEGRKKAVESIETARTEFAKLADEFKGDTTLRGQAIDGWAHAELALVGIPQEKDPNVDRGDVTKAAELFKQLAELVGPDTDTGKRLTKEAESLLAKKADVVQVAKDLNNKLTPAVNSTAPDLKLPPNLAPPAPPPLPGPKAPDAPIPPPATGK